MPSEIQITKYVCNVCGYAYENYNTAIMCENAAMIPEAIAHKIGETVSFELEDDLGTRSMSTFEPGTILAKTYLTTKNGLGFFEHHVAYVIKCREENNDWEERMAVWIDDGMGNKKLYSPPEFRFRKDYHLNMPKNLRIIEHISQITNG